MKRTLYIMKGDTYLSVSGNTLVCTFPREVKNTDNEKNGNNKNGGNGKEKERTYINPALPAEYNDPDTVVRVAGPIEKDGKKIETVTVKIPINRLQSIEVYGNIRFSVPALMLAAKAGVPVFFNTYGGKPIGVFYPETSPNPAVRRDQYAAYFDPEKRFGIAKAIVKKAITNRIKILRKFDKKNICTSEIAELEKYAEKTENTEKGTAADLRGIEGSYMKHYFSAFEKLLKNLEFRGRTQRPPKDGGNAVMGYGNTMLYGKITAYVFRTGLDPITGFLHEVHGSRASLAIDLAEIFRPIIVDNLILRLDRKGHLRTENHFEKGKNGGVYLNKRGKSIWVSAFNDMMTASFRYEPMNRKISVEEMFKFECYNLIKYLTGEKKNYTPLEFGYPK